MPLAGDFLRSGRQESPLVGSVCHLLAIAGTSVSLIKSQPSASVSFETIHEGNLGPMSLGRWDKGQECKLRGESWDSLEGEKEEQIVPPGSCGAVDHQQTG